MKFDEQVDKLLNEMAYLNLDKEGSLYPKDPATNKTIKPESFDVPENCKLIGTLKNHNLLREMDEDSLVIFAVPTGQEKATVKMMGEILGKDKYRVFELESSNDNKLSVVDIYHYLITVLGYTMVSDTEHTVGGKGLWQKLFTLPDLKFFSAVENHVNHPSVSRFGEWVPIKKSELNKPELFWDAESRTSRVASTAIMAVKK
jgi:hypothetical protein